jgi:hypothetical protein
MALGTQAFIQSFRLETINAFEQKQSILRNTVTTEVEKNGAGSVTFLVAGSGGEGTVTRGSNGLLPYSSIDREQFTATLVEHQAPASQPEFNIFASQGDTKRIMQDTVMSRINRAVDADIISELNTVTNSDAAAPATMDMIVKGIAELGNNDVEMDGKIFGLISPKFYARLSLMKEFASAEYVDIKPFASKEPMGYTGKPRTIYWNNVYWNVSNKIPNNNTASEKCFLYHKDAIGHACDTEGMNVVVGYDEKQDESYARARIFMKAKLLQSSGVYVFNHNATAI